VGGGGWGGVGYMFNVTTGVTNNYTNKNYGEGGIGGPPSSTTYQPTVSSLFGVGGGGARRSNINGTYNGAPGSQGICILLIP
jgi:hypothetical protein